MQKNNERKSLFSIGLYVLQKASLKFENEGHIMKRIIGIFAGVILVWSFAVPAAAAKQSDLRAHVVRRGDGKGGHVFLPAEYRIIYKPGGLMTMPFGIARMDNGEVALGCSWQRKDKRRVPVIAFSKDNGKTWSEFKRAQGVMGTPTMMSYLGNGVLMFGGCYSYDYGRTWEQSNWPGASNGLMFGIEGNNLVDRDANGVATRIANIGWQYQPGFKHPIDPATGMFRWSKDPLGKTWEKEIVPLEWTYDQLAGKVYARGVNEGSLVRADNGWIVAALRTDMPPRYFYAPGDDSLEGTGISISKDDGKTWSPINILFETGRHHGNLLKMPNGDLVLTVIVRGDYVDGAPTGKYASFMRGCDALISHDNGLTWNLDRRFTLDEYEYYNNENWPESQTGHLASTVLDDGYILTAYGNHLAKAAVLIRWKPDARPLK